MCTMKLLRLLMQWIVVSVVVVIVLLYVLGRRPDPVPAHQTPFSCSSAAGDRRCAVYAYNDGRPFVFAVDYLTSLGFPINDSAFSSSTDERQPRPTLNDVVFVTAADIWFFEIDMDAVGLVQRHFPHQPIIFYDLESAKRPRSQVDKIRRLCNVEYRAFDFDRYPPHVRTLSTYAFKPIIIHEVLASHRVVFWMDSSIRFHAGDLEAALSQINANGGLVMFDFSGHSIFAATHAGLYDYLPINRTTAVASGMWGACALLVNRDKQMYETVIRWWLLCALTAECIAPTMHRSCQFSGDRYANCHRFDQSAISVLLVNRHRPIALSLSKKLQAPVVDDVNNGSAAAATDRRVATVGSRGRRQKAGSRNQRPAAQNVLAFYMGSAPLKVDRGSRRRETIFVCSDDGDETTRENRTDTEYFQLLL